MPAGHRRPHAVQHVDADRPHRLHRGLHDQRRALLDRGGEHGFQRQVVDDVDRGDAVALGEARGRRSPSMARPARPEPTCGGGGAASVEPPARRVGISPSLMVTADGPAPPVPCGCVHADLRSNELTCFSTVLTEIISCSAIILSGRPFSSSARTSSSRLVRLADPSSRRPRCRLCSAVRTGTLGRGPWRHRLHKRRAVDALVQTTVRPGPQRGRHQVVVARVGQAEHRSVPGLDEPPGQLDAVGFPVVAESKARDHDVGVDDLL